MMQSSAIILSTVFAVSLCGSAAAFQPSQLRTVSARSDNRLRRSTCLNSLHMVGSASLLVTYGDVWSVVDELQAKQVITQRKGFEITGRITKFAPRAFALRAANAVGSAVGAIWRTFFRGPNEQEIRENLRLWALQRGGAVLPPLDDEELSNQVKYVGVFPELVEQMIDADLELEDNASKVPTKD